jgi:hypothetical protein
MRILVAPDIFQNAYHPITTPTASVIRNAWLIEALRDKIGHF